MINVFYRYNAPPADEPKLLLLTDGGVAVIGLCDKDRGFQAWSPLLKRIK